MRYLTWGDSVFTYSARRLSHSLSPSCLGSQECFMTVSADQGGKQTIAQLSFTFFRLRVSFRIVADSVGKTSVYFSIFFWHFVFFFLFSGSILDNNFWLCHNSECWTYVVEKWSCWSNLVLGSSADKFTLKSLVCCQVFGLTEYTQKYEVVKIQKCFYG